MQHIHLKQDLEIKELLTLKLRSCTIEKAISSRPKVFECTRVVVIFNQCVEPTS